VVIWHVPGQQWQGKVVDPAHPDHSLPGGRPPRPDQGLPPAPQPKR
jgi:hypothetical protein